ncbi:MAG TPA: SCO family protein [Steroidobacteraceae bacterium]|nr:SCO family protein [Steroidobacteraceae bacterium]
MKRGTLLLWALVGAAAVAFGVMLAQWLAPATVSLDAGTWLPRTTPVAPFHLSDLSGHDFSLASLRGHPTLLFFGFTNCPDICPLTLATLAQIPADALPDRQVVFVTIDPERDSAPVLRTYLSAFSPTFVGVRGPQSALAPLMHSLHASAERDYLPDGSYTMIHTATLYLLNTHGRLAAVFSPPFSAPALTADLRHIAASGRL